MAEPAEPKPEPTTTAKVVSIGLLALAAGGALLTGLVDSLHQKDFFLPGKNESNVDLAFFAGFYVAAQAIERLMEPFARFLPPAWNKAWSGYADKKPSKKLQIDAEKAADRAILMLGIATVIGVIASASLGLYFLRALGAKPALWLDIFVTALVISGGTKPLHDLISRIEKPKPTG